MCHEPSLHEHEKNYENVTEVPCMEVSAKVELIKQLKEAKRDGEVTYARILDRMERTGSGVSLSTLRRVFADGSEASAAGFSYENTLRPIAEVLLNVEDVPTMEGPYAKEIDALKAVIHCQNEEIVRLHELKEHLEARVTFLLEQIEKKDRRMDEKDALIQKLMEKVL